jgi:hypothetical protein
MPIDKETLVAEHETPATDHTPEPVKKLTIGLAAWVLAGGLAVLAFYAVFLR